MQTKKVIKVSKNPVIEELKFINSKIEAIQKAIAITKADITSIQKRLANFKNVNERLSELENRMRDIVSYSSGFYHGRRYVVTKAEEILCKQLGYESREQLTASDIPAFWVKTLTDCLTDPPNIVTANNIKMEAKDEQD